MLKSGRGLAILLLVFFALITDSNIATADNQLLFDTNLTIGDWQVHASQHSFSAEEARKARIKISKNTPDKQIQRAFFVLNGAFAFLRDFFIGDERVFEKDVTLSASNTLILVLLGEPGAEIAVQAIEGGERVGATGVQIPGVLDDLGLGPALQALAEEFSGRTGIRTDRVCHFRFPHGTPGTWLVRRECLPHRTADAGGSHARRHPFCRCGECRPWRAQTAVPHTFAHVAPGSAGRHRARHISCCSPVR